MNTVNTLYSSRDITNIKTAKSALALLNSNTKTDFHKVSKKFTTIMNQTTTNTLTKQIKRQSVALNEEEYEKQLTHFVEHNIYKPKVSINFADTEAPRFEIEFLKTYRMFEEAWDVGVKKLIKLTGYHMKKPNIRLVGNLTYTLVKIVINTDNPNPDTVEEEEEVRSEICSTKIVEIHNIESVKPTILNLKSNLEFAFHKSFKKNKWFWLVNK